MPSLRDSGRLFVAYPGLTSWANVFRPSGAGVFCSNQQSYSSVVGSKVERLELKARS